MRRVIFLMSILVVLLVFLSPVLFSHKAISSDQEDDACVRCHTNAKLIDDLVAKKRNKHAFEAAG